MLYLAMWKLLVKADVSTPEDFGADVTGGGFLDGLYFYRLPAKQCNDVDVAFRPISGIGAQRAFGSREVEGVTPLPGMDEAHDGGVQWYHSGVQFQVRGSSPGGGPGDVLDVARTADQIRDMLVQVAGGPLIVRWKDDVKGEEIVRCDISTAPRFYRQNRLEQPIAALQVEVWHRPERMAA